MVEFGIYLTKGGAVMINFLISFHFQEFVIVVEKDRLTTELKEYRA